MKVRSTIMCRSLVVFLCGILLQSALPLHVKAQARIKNNSVKNNDSQVIIKVGAPSVWSIGQAHYLLAKMHSDNRELETNMPDSTALDPNGINATKIQLLRTLLDVEAQLNEKVGAENRAELREQDFKVNQREQAEVKLREKQEELDNIDDDISRMSKRLARLQADANNRKVRRESQAKPNATPPVAAPLPDQSEEELLIEISTLTAQLDRKKIERDNVAKEVADLKTQASQTVAKPSLSEVQFTSTATLPTRSAFVEELAKNAADSIKQPKLAASIALDNFIGMQYEIIAKQLTLLRDEAGPENRVVFLELPSAVYTVPCKGDNYLAQVHWEVESYFQETEDEEKKNRRTRIEYRQKKMEANRKEANTETSEAERTAMQVQLNQDEEKYQNAIQDYNPDKNYDLLRRGITDPNQTHIKGNWIDATPDTVRALDIIPRQSALNINDVQSTVSQKNFLGVMKLLVGFGIRVNYQRQRELYEQYLQQEVFASGFGKGSNAFGWTFGPLPGTKRIAPGARTTYAVLAVPKNTSLLRLKATGLAYKREEAPTHGEQKQEVFREEFNVLIPNIATEQYVVKEAWYTPVKRGEAVTLLLRGSYFSPQAAVIVDGVPLAKSLSLGNTATSNAGTDNVAASGVRGQFELASSRELIMKFSMGNDKYIGTPDITVVTPEKAGSINRYIMDDVNNIDRVSLKDMSIQQPMFFEDFGMEEKLTIIGNRSANYIMARLKGTGLRPDSSLWVNNRLIPYNFEKNPLSAIARNNTQEFITQVDTGEYFLYFRNPGAYLIPPNLSLDKWSIRYRQQTIRGFDAREFEHKFPSDPDPDQVEVRNYSPDAARKKSRLDVRIISRNPMVSAELSPRSDGHRLGPVVPEGGNNYRAVFELNFDAQGEKLVEKSKVSITVNRGSNVKTHDLPLPVRPRATTFLISPPINPQEGGSVITIEGINLHLVDKVLIGDKEAEIISNSDSDKLVIRLKSGVFVQAGEGVQIPIVMVTKDGTKIPAVVTVEVPEDDQIEKPERPYRRRPYISRKQPY